MAKASSTTARVCRTSPCTHEDAEVLARYAGFVAGTNKRAAEVQRTMRPQPSACYGSPAQPAGRVVVEAKAEAELSREEFFEQAHERWKEHAVRIDNVILTVVKAQIIVERFMISFLEAHGKDAKHFFFTAPKIKECRRTDPPEVGQTMWDLLTLCTYVRNELVHSLDNEQIKAKMEAVRTAYIAATGSEVQKKSIREMTDTQMVTDAIYHCGSLIVIATDNKVAQDKKQKSAG
jgi:hypothetical protein